VQPSISRVISIVAGYFPDTLMPRIIISCACLSTSRWCRYL